MRVTNDRIFRAVKFCSDYSLVSKRKIRIPGIDGKKVILFIGRFIPNKGVEYLLEAYAKLEIERDDTALLLAGYGELEPAYRKQAKRLGIKECFFLDKIEDIEVKAYLYDLASAVAVPSVTTRKQNDGGPYIILEALSAGTPVGCSDVTGNTGEFIWNGWNGYVVPQKNSLALYRALKHTLSDQERAMGEKARTTYRSIGGFDQQIESLSACIEYALK